MRLQALGGITLTMSMAACTGPAVQDTQAGLVAASSEANRLGVLGYQIGDHTATLVGKAGDVGTLTLSRGVPNFELHMLDGYYAEIEITGPSTDGLLYAPSGDQGAINVVSADPALAGFFAQEGIHFIAVSQPSESKTGLSPSAGADCSYPPFVNGDDPNGNYAVKLCNATLLCTQIVACYEIGSGYVVRMCSCPRVSCGTKDDYDAVELSRLCIGSTCTNSSAYKGCTTSH